MSGEENQATFSVRPDLAQVDFSGRIFRSVKLARKIEGRMIWAVKSSRCWRDDQFVAVVRIELRPDCSGRESSGEKWCAHLRLNSRIAQRPERVFRLSPKPPCGAIN